MIKILAALMVVLLLPTMSACSPTALDTLPNASQNENVAITQEQQNAQTPIFEVVLENGGVLRGELYPDIAPESVGNFVELANSGFYDGLIFHRVIPGFVIQGGCPLGEGYGGPGWNIKGEFSANGIENELKHTYGVLSWARSAAPDSAGSQFFIMMGDSSNLDGSYAAFGKVTEGMEYADAIVETPRNQSDKPLTPQTIKSIRVETFGIEYPFTKIQ